MNFAGLIAMIYGGVATVYQLGTWIYMSANAANNPMSPYYTTPNYTGAYLMAISFTVVIGLVGAYLFFGGRLVLDLAFPAPPEDAEEIPELHETY